jgi:hypothetical protein
MRICCRCHIEKPYNEFYKDKTQPNGYGYDCKDCRKVHMKKDRLNNLEKYKQRTAKTHSSIPPSVYQIKCLINNKRYIGQSTRPYKRILCEHLTIHKNFDKKCLISSPELQADLKQYGRNNFVYEILESCSPELLLERELYYITTLKPEYNGR